MVLRKCIIKISSESELNTFELDETKSILKKIFDELVMDKEKWKSTFAHKLYWLRRIDQTSHIKPTQEMNIAQFLD